MSFRACGEKIRKKKGGRIFKPCTFYRLFRARTLRGFYGVLAWKPLTEWLTAGQGFHSGQCLCNCPHPCHRDTVTACHSPVVLLCMGLQHSPGRNPAPPRQHWHLPGNATNPARVWNAQGTSSLVGSQYNQVPFKSLLDIRKQAFALPVKHHQLSAATDHTSTILQGYFTHDWWNLFLLMHQNH